LHAILLQCAIALATLATVELFLRTVDLRYLSDTARPGDRDTFRFDPELGWSPIPNSSANILGSHRFHVSHNSLGIRDIEQRPDGRPTILFVGDSFTWGFDAEADERFSELLRRSMPERRIVNAGVNSFGTDQQLLFMQRLWNDVQPNVVVLMFCVDNDRADNTSNVRNDGMFKPYFLRGDDGEWQMRGAPVPPPRRWYFKEYWLPRHVWLARLAVSAYIAIAHPRLTVPDPTDFLIRTMREYVEKQGATFMVAINRRDEQLEAFLKAQAIPFTSLHEAERFPYNGAHWTPEGHGLVAARLQRLLFDVGVASPTDRRLDQRDDLNRQMHPLILNLRRPWDWATMDDYLKPLQHLAIPAP
jgi:hypothetical protein